MVATLIEFPRTTISSRPSPVDLSRPGVRSPETRAMYRRRRIVAAGALVATLLVLLIALQAALGRSDGGPLTTIGSAGGAQPAAAHLYVVKPGDTLWTIALASGAKGDIRPLVDRLSAEVHGQPLQPGQQILVP
jgi:hypothetical protein